jgi:putative ABC transport system substrate-binding protein
MRRRDVLRGVICAAISSETALAQPRVWRIGILETATAELNRTNLEIFNKRLRELGYIDGQNLVTLYRSADGNERLATLVAELIAFKPDLIVVRGTPEVLAAKNAARSIPVVMAAVGDPVAAGVVASLSRPGGNITGMASVTTETERKRVELLKEAVPSMTRMGFVADFRNFESPRQWDEVLAAARLLGVEPLRLEVRSAADIVLAFETAAKERVHAVRFNNSSITRPNRRLIVDLAARYKMPAVYAAREFAEEGGLISFAPDYAHLYSRAANFVDRILKGEKPADLPIELPTKFELVINLKTAKALGLTIPPTLLARADEVIE